MTQEDLADACDIHTTEISRIENGKRNPTWETMKRLAGGLRVPCWHMVALAEALDLERGSMSQIRSGAVGGGIDPLGLG